MVRPSPNDRLPPVVTVRVLVLVGGGVDGQADPGEGEGEGFFHPSSSLHSQLEYHARRMCPGTEDEADRRAWMDTVEGSIDRWGDGNDDATNDEDPASKRRKPQQIQQQQQQLAASSSATTTTTTTSLFSWADTSLLKSLVTWEEIQGAASSQASEEEGGVDPLENVLPLLQRVVHLDDLLPDWSDVVPLVRDGLLRHQSPSSRADDPSYHSLAVKWLTSTRSSMRAAFPSVQSIPAHLQRGGGSTTTDHGSSWGGGEATHWDVQTDLLYLLVVHHAGAAALDSCGNDDDDYDSDIVRRTWLDWMLRFGRSAVRDARVRAIGTTLWNWAIVDLAATAKAVEGKEEDNDSSPHISSSSSSFYHHAILRHDPHARWFQAWVDLLDSVDVRELLQRATTTTTSTSQPPAADVPPTTTVPPLANLVSHVRSLLTTTEEAHGSGAASTILQAAHGLCLLRSALVRLRVSHFPWEQLQKHRNPNPRYDDDNNPVTVAQRHRRDGVVAIGDLYLQLLSQVLRQQPQRSNTEPQDTGNNNCVSLSNDYCSGSSDEWVDVTTRACCDALDVLLSGAIHRAGDAPIAAALLAKIRSLATTAAVSTDQGRQSQRLLLQLAGLYEGVVGPQRGTTPCPAALPST